MLDGGRVIGTLFFGAGNRPYFNADELALMKTVADHWPPRCMQAGRAGRPGGRKPPGQRLAEIEDLYLNAPVGLCVLDRDLRWVRINERLAEINGIPAADHIGRTVRELMPELADAVEPEMRRVLETGEPRLDIEIVAETPAQPGVERSWMEQWLPLRDAEGRVTGLSIVVEETTERRQAEANQALLTEVLAILNRGGGLESLIGETLRAIQRDAGFDAVGLRLRKATTTRISSRTALRKSSSGRRTSFAPSTCRRRRPRRHRPGAAGMHLRPGAVGPDRPEHALLHRRRQLLDESVDRPARPAARRSADQSPQSLHPYRLPVGRPVPGAPGRRSSACSS